MNTYSIQFLYDFVDQTVEFGRDPYNRIGFADIDMSEAFDAFDRLIVWADDETSND